VALNLAWMLVLSVPMSVLVAALMAFGGLSASNEIVIMRASGMSLYRMMAPVLILASLVTLALIRFNNAVLPEANIRLRTLMSDVLRIKPTLSLRAGIFSSSEDLPNYRILVRKTFPENNNLEGVTIYDLSRPDKKIVVTAESGVVSFTPDYSRLIMDLKSGEIHEMNSATFANYRKLRFTRHRVSIPAEGFGFSRSDAQKAQRDDRTMSAGAMRVIVDSIRKVQEGKQRALRTQVAEQLDALTAPIVVGSRSPVFHREFAGGRGTPPHAGRRASRDTAVVPPPQSGAERDCVARAIDRVRRMEASLAAQNASIDFDERQMDKYLVEIYKKYSIPVACIVFVLIGAPLGIMARRGGFGIGIGLSFSFFLLYWACLIGGEKLADRDITSPFVGMWIANIVIGAIGLLLTFRSARESLVIDWTALSRFVPRRWRIDAPATGTPQES
jgi:lipopolysaccharide export system permease protein